jgi:acetyltransferase-like isoleucine patch superfamily enzyme
MHGAQIGRRLSVHGRMNLYVHRAARITIGNDVRMKSGFGHNPVGAARRLGLWVGKDGHLRIGNGVAMSNCTIVCMNSVTIHDQAFIGGGVDIFDTDFHSIDPQLRQLRPDPDVRVASVIIGSRSFIGGRSIILKGVEIGAGAVIGAGSVVRQNVPAGEIWAGNPARPIGQVKPRSDKNRRPLTTGRVSEG